MKKLTIQFAGYGLQDETAVSGFETSAEMLDAVAKGKTKFGEPFFDYETGTLWKIMDDAKKDELLDCYKDEEIKIAKMLGNEHMTLIAIRMSLENIINEKVDHDAEIRKQVCDEIRHTVTLDNTDNGYLDQQVDIYNLYEILDEIERGAK